jgi:hypothetical protein
MQIPDELRANLFLLPKIGMGLCILAGAWIASAVFTLSF